MLNDRSTPLSLLATRRSSKPRDMAPPGPTQGQLDRLLTVATRVPDHGKLMPWRFVVVHHEHRDAFRAMLLAAYDAEVAEPDAGTRAKLAAFGDDAPCLVAVLSRVVPFSAIPAFEQELSAGAACMMLCAAASAMGFGASWLTGWASRSVAVTASLGQAGDRIAGFVFIGTPTCTPTDRPRPDLATVVRRWDG